MVGRMDPVVRHTEIRPGDVVFLQPGLDDPISEWIAEADTGIFSHCAIACDGETMIGAALRGLQEGPDLDAGGVMLSSIGAELDSRLGPPYIGRPKVNPGPALQQANAFLEPPDGQPAHKSGFSMAKSLLMMAGLCAAHANDGKLRDLVLRAGRLWSVEEEIAHRQMPSFICAELVVFCYGQPFTWGDLHQSLQLKERLADADADPPAAGDPGRDRVDERHRPGLGKLLETPLGIWRELREVGDHTLRQMATLGEVALYMEVRHRAFLDKCLGSGAELAWEVLKGKDPGPDRGGEAAPTGDLGRDEGTIVDDRTIPACLVTPRTLANASWLQWVRPLEVEAEQGKVLLR